MFTEIIIEMAVKIAVTLLITLFGILGTWLAAKIAKRNELAGIAAATNEVTDAAQRVVLDLEQTVVGKLKDASEDGKLTESEIEYLGALLLEKALTQISTPAKKLLEAAGKDVCAIIKSAGEALIQHLRKG